jgi:uncharacterized protein YbjT (DUF2867 family)
MLLVTGATGNIGSEAVRLLLAAGQQVRVLSRSAEKGRALGAVDVVVGDVTNAATLPQAMAGVTKLLALVPGADLVPSVAPRLFTAAKAAGVRHVVFVSSGTIDFTPQVTIGRWHLEAEATLKATGLPWTMLRPDNFASNSLRWAGSVRGQSMVYAPSAQSQSVPIDPRDIAAVAVCALTTEGHAGQTYELSGPEALTTAEQVAQLAEVLGRPLKLVEVPEAQVREGMRKGGMSPAQIDPVLELMRPGARGGPPRLTHTVQQLTGQPARRFADWARDHVKAFQ